jgi:hypothetical protein
LGRENQFRELANSALPELRSQMVDANRILQTASTSRSAIEGKQPTATGKVGGQENSKVRQD